MKNLNFKNLSSEQIKNLKINDIVYYMNEKVKILSFEENLSKVKILTLRKNIENVSFLVDISTLEILTKILRKTIDLKFEYYPEIRQCGNTTRIVDAAIQALYNGYRIIIVDHIKNPKSDYCLFQKIVLRLNNEFKYSNFEIDEKYLEIELKD